MQTPPPELVNQVGVGGAIVLAGLGIVLHHVRATNKKDTTIGGMDLAVLQMEMRKAVADSIGPSINKQTEIMEHQTALMTDFGAAMKILTALQDRREHHRDRG